MAYRTDIEIAQACRMKRISEIAESAGIDAEYLELYGNYKAKVDYKLLRDKKGVHNSFSSPDSINEFHWDNLKQYPQVFEYYRGLISIRKNHPAFRLANADAVRKHLEFIATDDCLVAFRLKHLEGIDSWKDIVVVLNANRHAKTVNIPEAEYTVACCNGVINEEGIGMPFEGKEVLADEQSALILYRK